MPELPADGDREESAMLEYSLVMNEFWPYAFGDDQQATLSLLLAQAGSNIMREWYLVANMGAQMAEHEQQTGTTLRRPLIWMGGGHAESLGQKFEHLGISLETVRSNYDIENNIDQSPFTQAVGRLAIDGVLRLG